MIFLVVSIYWVCFTCYHFWHFVNHLVFHSFYVLYFCNVVWFGFYLVLLCLVLLWFCCVWFCCVWFLFFVSKQKRSSFVDTSWKSIFIYIPNHVKTPPTKKTTTTKSTCVCGPMAKTVRCQRIHRGSIPRNRTLNFWLLKIKTKSLYSSVGRAHDWSKNNFTKNREVRCSIHFEDILFSSKKRWGQVTKWLRCCIKAAVRQLARVQIASCSFLSIFFFFLSPFYLFFFVLFYLFCSICFTTYWVG